MRTPPALPQFYCLVDLDRIDSTNEEAKRRATQGAAEGLIVWALSQSAGRGRRGRDWVSPPGNLYVSVLLRPRGAAAPAAQLGLAAALAVADACAHFLPAGVVPRCKWPNDVLIGGGKVAGILLESRAGAANGLDFLILGIGVNLRTFPSGTELRATSLAAEGCGAVAPEAMLAILAERLLGWYEVWREPGGFATVRAAWLGRAHQLGDELSVRLPAAELRGRFAGLDEHGLLLLDGPDGRRCIAAADIFPAT